MATRGRQVQYSPGGRLIFLFFFLYPTIQLLQFSLVDNWSWNDPFWVQEGQRDAHFIIRVCMQQVTQYVCTCVECILQADSRNCCASLLSTSVLEYIWAPSLSVIQCLRDGIKSAGLSFSAVLFFCSKVAPLRTTTMRDRLVWYISVGSSLHATPFRWCVQFKYGFKHLKLYFICFMVITRLCIHHCTTSHVSSMQLWPSVRTTLHTSAVHPLRSSAVFCWISQVSRTLQEKKKKRGISAFPCIATCHFKYGLTLGRAHEHAVTEECPQRWQAAADRTSAASQVPIRTKHKVWATRK